MKGIAKIKGSLNPKIGEDSFYEVVEFHKGTPMPNPNSVKWKLFKKNNGKWEEAKGNSKTGMKVAFNFSPHSYGKEVLVEAYLFEPEMKSPPGLVVKPVLGPRKILNTEILDANGNKITQTPKYGQSITLKVTTQNMPGEILKLSLWERDTFKDSGHDPEGNTRLWSGQSKTIDIKGIVEEKIMLTLAMKSDANKSLFDGSEHEYYLLAEASGMKTISATTQVSIEEVPTTPAKKTVEKPKEAKPIAKQTPVKIKNAVGADEIKADDSNKVVKVAVPEEGKNCEDKYCIKKGDKSELIREINIRLAGFGGNVPTDEFTDRTEKMIKQFQRDYMKVPESGKVCGNVLRAIDEFQSKYLIHFEDTRCKCGKCKGYGNNKFVEQKQDSKIIELARKYEYPGIHRSLIWAVRASMFYCAVVEDDLKYSIKCIFSAYRCHEDNKIHKRSSTNHMGKAVDLHMNKDGVRTQVIKNVDEIRQKVFVKHLGSQIRWDNKNVFSLEPGVNPKYKGEFLATTWIHLDVRQFELKYLEDKFFVKTLSELNGESIVFLANKTSPDLCKCIGGGLAKKTSTTNISQSKQNNFTEEDGKEALKIIYDKYGKDMAIIIERMYRDETGHFKSKQYTSCGTGGMEAHGEAPFYGWDNSFFESYPEFHPMGLWEAFENKGMSGEGGNTQVTDKKKKFVILPSVIGGMEYKAFYIIKHGGNFARWHSTNPSNQATYKKYLEKITPRFVNEFEKK